MVRTSALALMVLLILPVLARSTPVFSNVGKCSLQQYPIPESKALDTCQHCEIDDTGILTCVCSDKSGKETLSSLAIYACPKSYAYPQCASEIGLVDGRLYCRKISAESTYDERGCFSCSKIGTHLRCDCVKEGRAHVSTELDLSKCDLPISNCKGRLTCGLCQDKGTSSWIWLQASLVGASAVTVAIVVVRNCLWKKIIRQA